MSDVVVYEAIVSGKLFTTSQTRHEGVVRVQMSLKILVLIEVFVTADARVSFRNPLEKLVAVIEPNQAEESNIPLISCSRAEIPAESC
jgi:hypothetical protein